MTNFSLSGWIVCVGVCCIFLLSYNVYAQLDVDRLAVSNVKWTSPDADPQSFMPTGNGEYGLNVWANSNNEVYLYISSTSSWGSKLYQNNTTGSDGSGPNKLGKIRLVLPNNIFAGGFTQTLKLHESLIEITGGSGDAKITLTIWVDANNPVIHIEAAGKNSFAMSAYAEKWAGSIGSNIVYASGQTHTETVGWYYRNPDLYGGKTMWDSTMTEQFGAGNAIGTDPIRNRTYGAFMNGDGFIKNQNAISSSGKNEYAISIYSRVEQTPDIQTWITHTDNAVSALEILNVSDVKNDHLAWWDSFWNRSWITLEGNTPDEKAITQDYLLQRYISACAGRGRYPIKFNGSIFLADNAPSGVAYSPDVRVWGPHYWIQNTRLIYWPMLADGDYDMMLPFFRMYMDALPARIKQTKNIHGVEGAIWPEVMTIFGTFATEHYRVKNNYIWREYTGSLEILTMMLDMYAHTQDKAFLTDNIIPASEQVLAFFEHNFTTLDGNGKIILKNVNALETFWNIDNSAADIAGLQDVLNKLISLPDDSYNGSLRLKWTAFRNKIPALPYTIIGNQKKLLPHATQGAQSYNSEAPELYSVFPFRIYGKTKPDLNVAKYTYERRTIYADYDWRQDPIWAAYLGETAKARSLLIGRYSNKNWNYRFPGIYGPFLDWIPDQCHANVANITLQAMLMHTDNDSIYLFPSWPDEWNVSFKLNAPKNTTVEVVYRDGNITSLLVTPAERRKDVVILNNKTSTSVIPEHGSTAMVCYPVPAKEQINIQTAFNIRTASVQLINYAGALMNIDLVQETDYSAVIKLTHLSPGIYFIRVITDNNVITQKIIIE